MIDILNTSGRISIRTKSEVTKTAKEIVNVAQADKLLPLFEDIAASEQRAKDYAQTLIDNLINGSPAALDTLYELSAALGDDPNFAASIMEQIGTRASKDIATQLASGLMSAADKDKLDGIIIKSINIVALSLPAGAEPTVTNIGTPEHQVLNFGIPAGVQGLQGSKGDKGDTGAQGIQGLRGIQGLQGPKGDTGEQGIQGVQGLKGDKGDTGAQGIQGLQGPQGPQGATGNIGTSHMHRTIIVRSANISIHPSWNPNLMPGSTVKYISAFLTDELNIAKSRVDNEETFTINLLILNTKGDNMALFRVDSYNTLIIKPGINYFSLILSSTMGWIPILITQGADIPSNFN